jgi:hypothetical protein
VRPPGRTSSTIPGPSPRKGSKVVTIRLAPVPSAIDLAVGEHCTGLIVLTPAGRGQWDIESALGPFSAWDRGTSTGCAGNGPQVMVTLRNIVISLLHLADITQVTRTI